MDYTYTVLRDTDGDEITCGYDGCDNSAVKEYCGYCERCWLILTAEERAILQGREPPPPREIIRTETKVIVQPKEKEIVTHRTITTRIPPAWHSVALILWRCVITAVAGYLMAKAKGWL